MLRKTDLKHNPLRRVLQTPNRELKQRRRQRQRKRHLKM